MFRLVLQPRFSETDGLGHINNAVLPVWFEEARTEIFRVFNPSLSLDTWNLILKRYDIEFIAQIRREHPVEIETGLEKIGVTSLTVLQRAFQQGAPVAQGRTTLVHFDYAAARTAPIPGAIREQLRAHVIPAGTG